MNTSICMSSPKVTLGHLNNDASGTRRPDESSNTREPVESSDGVHGGDGCEAEREIENTLYGLNPSLRKLRTTSLPPSLEKYSNLEQASSLNVIWDPLTGNQLYGIGARPKNSSANRPVENDERSLVVPRPKNGSNEAINRRNVLQRSEASLASPDNTSNKRWEEMLQRRQEQSRKRAEFFSNHDVSGAACDGKKAISLTTLTRSRILYTIGEK
ncbi:unnamed protein product [Owenia fusiformis]|nr:unnamed protein product [Owenia fusiformis]